MHNFNSKSTASFRVSEEILMEELENTKHEGTIFIVSKLHKESQRKGSITIKDSSRPIESLKAKFQTEGADINLYKSMELACSKRSTKVPNDAPLRFLQLVDAFNTATAGDLARSELIFYLNRYRRGLETCPQTKTFKSGREYFLLFFPTRPSDEYESTPSLNYSRPLLDVFACIG